MVTTNMYVPMNVEENVCLPALRLDCKSTHCGSFWLDSINFFWGRGGDYSEIFFLLLSVSYALAL